VKSPGYNPNSKKKKKLRERDGEGQGKKIYYMAGNTLREEAKQAFSPSSAMN
jgi:hypothetical protein